MNVLKQRKILNSKYGIWYNENGEFLSFERWTNEGWIYAPFESVPKYLINKI